ncbi:alpha/beta hydrolase [Pendulispora rubella]|uniref:Alpha/beta hydrolase n=1 Tax=Pendulispora rubella TaxID=2741070 RepID=A0ABZ2KQJ3_9BACT
MKGRWLVAGCGLALALQLGCGSRVESPVQKLGGGFEEGVSDVEGIRVHHVQGGKGPTVLLIPGYFQTWYAWRDVMPALVRAGFHVVAVDPRGMGESSRPANGYDTGRVAADLHGLMRQLGHERYAVVGHDVGSWIAYALAGDHPEVVERLALIEGILPGLLGPSDVFMPDKESVAFWHFMFNRQPELPELLIAGRERTYLGWLFDHWSYKRDAIALDVYAKTYAEPGAVSAQLAYYRAFPETMAQNQKRATQKLGMPVLALGGDHAKGNKQLAMVQPLGTDVRGGVLPDCGHFAPEECSGALTEQVLSFLRQ